MPNQLVEYISRLPRAPRKAVGIGVRQFRVLAKSGLRGSASYARYALQARQHEYRWANGLVSQLDTRRARQWRLYTRRHLLVVAVGTSSVGVNEWVRDVVAIARAHVAVAPSVYDVLDGSASSSVTRVDLLGTDDLDLSELREWIFQNRRTHDILLVDLAQPLPDPTDILRLHHVTEDYASPQDAPSLVVPAHESDGVTLAGWEWDHDARRWIARVDPRRDYGQGAIPRFVLGAAFHGLLITASALDRLTLKRNPGVDLDRQAMNLIRSAWQANMKTLAYSPVKFPVDGFNVPDPVEMDYRWLTGRTARTEDGRLRVVYVLPATSISGGIRTVFEQCDRLLDRGVDAEIWSLQRAPDWMDIRTPVKTFPSYHDLEVALRDVDAIKVATWWESAQTVWLASVNSGVGVYYVQEFETWFYPDDLVSQAAVAASYRPELEQITIADYQRHELEEIGIRGTTISSAYDPETFHVLERVERDPNTLLAVGRSFFQKNFALTLAGWKSMGDARPHLVLYGFEPELVNDERSEYVERPSNEVVNELYNRATCFVQTSIHEGFGLPILEAMAAGCPVITTDSHGNRDFCVDGENCIVVPHGDPGELGRQIGRLIGDPDLQDRMRSAGLETAARYTWDHAVEKMVQVFASIEKRS